MFDPFSLLCLKELGNKIQKQLPIQLYTNGSDVSISSPLPPCNIKKIKWEIKHNKTKNQKIPKKLITESKKNQYIITKFNKTREKEIKTTHDKPHKRR